MAESSEPAPANGIKIGSNERDVMLVIATLIAAATFQAGVNPPGGIWQDDKDGHRAGSAIYASRPFPFYVFIYTNTFALSASLLSIIRLASGLPLQSELRIGTVLMMVTYVSAIFAVTPRGLVMSYYVLIAATLPVIMLCTVRVVGKVVHKIKESQPSPTRSQ